MGGVLGGAVGNFVAVEEVEGTDDERDGGDGERDAANADDGEKPADNEGAGDGADGPGKIEEADGRGDVAGRQLGAEKICGGIDEAVAEAVGENGEGGNLPGTNA